MPAWLASSWLLLPLLPPLLLPLLLGVKGATSDWRGDEELAAAAQRLLGCEARESCCEIAELWDEAAKAWLTRHQRNDRSDEHDVPRLLRFRPHTAAQQQGIWSRPELLRRHGDLRLERRRAVEVAQFGPGHAYEAPASSAGTISLRAAAAALRRPGGADQWFDRGVGPTLLEAATAGGAELPSVNQLSSLQAAANESVLSLGRSRSGLPFHSHGESWLALLRGQKLWLLLPPGPLEVSSHFESLKRFIIIVYSLIHCWLFVLNGWPDCAVAARGRGSWNVGAHGHIAAVGRLAPGKTAAASWRCATWQSCTHRVRTG